MRVGVVAGQCYRAENVRSMANATVRINWQTLVSRLYYIIYKCITTNLFHEVILEIVSNEIINKYSRNYLLLFFKVNPDVYIN